MTALLDVLKCAAVDEYGQLDSDLARLDAEHHYESRKRRKEALREVILGWHKDLPADEEAIEHGVEWDLPISACDDQRVVSIAGKTKLEKLWGRVKFRELCNVILKLLPDPKDPKGLYTIHARTGPRHIRKPLPALKLAA
jgi:hypothetical protein